MRLAQVGLDKAVLKELPQWGQNLQNWIRTCDILGGNLATAFPFGYRNLMLYFSNEEGLQKFYEQKALENATNFAGWDYFYLKTTSSAEQIAQIRFLGQLLGTVWSASPKSILYFCRRVMESPDGLLKEFLPASDIDLREVFSGAIRDYQVNIF